MHAGSLVVGLVIGFAIGAGGAYFLTSENLGSGVNPDSLNTVVNTIKKISPNEESLGKYVGKSAVSKDIKYTLLKVEKSKYPIQDGVTLYQTPKEARDGAVFLIVKMEMENVGKTTQWMSERYDAWSMTDSLGRSYYPGTTNISFDSMFRLSVAPGLKATGSIGYEVPDDPDLSFSMPILGKIT